jgi:hypothetical protein
MQVICDPRDLNGTQRRAVAEFILNFPSACAGSCGTATVAAEIKDSTELATLQHDHESTIPAAAFGAPVAMDPAAAFGGAQPAAPLAASIPPMAASTVAPAAAIAPITTMPGVASSVAVASSVDLDKQGLPWDGRIHAESKGKIADGTWRKKRNVDPGLVAQVEAELRQVMGAPAAPLAVSTAPSAPTPLPATVAPVTANSPTASVSPAVVPPPPAPAPGAALGDERQQFVALIGRTSAALQGGKITQEEITQCCQAAGLPALPLLANRLDLVAMVGGSIDAIIASHP